MARYQLDWSFGLKHSDSGNFLTAETFGGRLECAASKMKKKQIFFLEQEADGSVALKSKSTQKYISVDGDGGVNLADAKGSEELFLIEAQASGEWALKSKQYEWYIGTTAAEGIRAFTKEVTSDKLWKVVLAMHPHICLKNIKRRRYVHFDADKLTCNDDIPWGHDATLSIACNTATGTYSLQASNGQFLTAGGSLSPTESADTAFILEFDGGMVAFKGQVNGKYLTCLGASGLCKATKEGISDNERFVLEDSWPQVTLKARDGQDKLISIKQGIEIGTFGDAITDNEIFQFEPSASGQWIIKCQKDKLWQLVDGGVQVIGEPVAADEAPAACLWDVEFKANGAVTIAQGGSYVVKQMNKYLKVNGSDPEADRAQFTFELINRPKIVLRGEYGFVGTLPSGLLECNKSEAEVYDVSIKDGMYALANATSGKYWVVGDNGVSCTGDAAEYYDMQLHKESKLTLGLDGKLFSGSQNGEFKASGAGANKETLFEY